jgi:hypothetical protein
MVYFLVCSVVWALLSFLFTREAMRVFGASVHSEPIVQNVGLPQGTEIPTDKRASRRESGFWRLVSTI